MAVIGPATQSQDSNERKLSGAGHTAGYQTAGNRRNLVMWKRNTRDQDARYANNVPPLTAEIEREVLTTLSWVFGFSVDAEPISDEGALAQEWTREGGTGGWFWLNWRSYSYAALRTGDGVKRERIRQELRRAAMTQVHGNPHPFWRWLISSCDAAGSVGEDSPPASPG
jgi:hypothetical protein